MKANTSVIQIRGEVVKKTINLGKKTAVKLNKILSQFYPISRPLPLIQHEVSVLRRLSGYNICPKVLSVGNDWFTMSYVGESVTLSSKFWDLSTRVSFILFCLSTEGIRHNDLRESFQNYTCKEGLLFLVDFQLADIGETRPSTILQRKLKPRSWDDIKDLKWLENQFG